MQYSNAYWDNYPCLLILPTRVIHHKNWLQTYIAKNEVRNGGFNYTKCNMIIFQYKKG